MIGALAGFALVFVVTAVTVSALAAAMLGLVRRSGPLVARRAAMTAAILPVFAGVLAVGALVLQALAGADHCTVHDHHAHLCFAHGAHWGERSWVVVVLAIAGATFSARAVLAVAGYLRGDRSLRALHRTSALRDGVRIVPSERAFCFASRHGVFASSRVWAELSLDERTALLAHEQAHLGQHDLALRALLEAMLVFAAPLAADVIRGAWLRATERLCDAHAAGATSPETVARAMVSMCRLGSQPAPGFSFTPAAAELANRIRAVLDGAPLGIRAARTLAWMVLTICLALAVAGMAAAGPLHHGFETLLG